MRPFMWQQIIVMAAWQCLVMTILMFFGGLMLFKENRPHLVRTPLRDENLNGTNRLIMDTFIFHVFMLMNLFNAINCRIIAMDQLNVFATIHHNWIFIIVLGGEMFFQQWMVSCGSQQLTIQAALLGTGELTTTMNVVAWVLGALSLAVGVVSKTLPQEKFQFTADWTLEQDLSVREKIWQFFAYLLTLCKKKEEDTDASAPAEAAAEEDKKAEEEEGNDLIDLK